MSKRLLAIALMVAFAITLGCKEPPVEEAKKVDVAKVDVAKKEKKPKTYTVSGGPEIGTEAPEIEGVDLDGVEFKLSDYRGKVVMLDFYGDW